jgi:hypothetical protein
MVILYFLQVCLLIMSTSVFSYYRGSFVDKWRRKIIVYSIEKYGIVCVVLLDFRALVVLLSAMRSVVSFFIRVSEGSRYGWQ